MDEERKPGPDPRRVAIDSGWRTALSKTLGGSAPPPADVPAYRVEVESDGAGGFVAVVPAFGDAIRVDGETEQEATHRAWAEIEKAIVDMRKAGEEPPAPDGRC